MPIGLPVAVAAVQVCVPLPAPVVLIDAPPTVAETWNDDVLRPVADTKYVVLGDSPVGSVPVVVNCTGWLVANVFANVTTAGLATEIVQVPELTQDEPF